MGKVQELKSLLEASVSYEIRKHIDANPDDADNMEDLLNWTLDKFKVNDEAMIDAILKYIRDNSNLPN